MKRFITLFLALMMVFACVGNAAAIDALESASAERAVRHDLYIAELAAQIDNETMEEIPPLVRTRRHEQLICDPNYSTRIDEYEIIQAARENIAELQGGEDTAGRLSQVDSMEENARAAIFARKALSDAQLITMGYGPAEIRAFRNLTGSETLAELSALNLTNEVSCYNVITEHYYDTSENRTYLIAEYGWEWVRGLANEFLEDCIGVGWNNDFSPDNSLIAWYNKTFFRCAELEDHTSISYYSVDMYENELNTSQAQFDLRGPFDTERFVISGYGTMCLSQADLANNAKFSFKYAHNTGGITPSISIPWGVSFSFEDAEEVFRPTAVASHSPAEVVN